MKKLSNDEMKKVMGGHQFTINPGDGGGGCMDQYSYGCSLGGNTDSDLKCCSGYTCEMNASNSGTICV